jgi:predicted MFS family arabinose efflux permease
MLAASSVGSLLAERWVSRSALPRALVAICASLALYAVVLPELLAATLGASTTVRIAIAAATVAPIGLLMGTPFPTGIRRAGREDASLVSWAWAVNGAASVLGTTLTVLVSMTYGFATSFFVGASAYAFALVVMTWVMRKPEIPRRAEARSPEPETLGVP